MTRLAMVMAEKALGCLAGDPVGVAERGAFDAAYRIRVDDGRRGHQHLGADPAHRRDDRRAGHLRLGHRESHGFPPTGHEGEAAREREDVLVVRSAVADPLVELALN
jgi:hypothetical protein